MDSAALAKEPFVSITTFKRDGTPVSVPVWCAADNGRLLVFSEADSWKVKRIRRDAHVRLAPCSASTGSCSLCMTTKSASAIADATSSRD